MQNNPNEQYSDPFHGSSILVQNLETKEIIRKQLPKGQYDIPLKVQVTCYPTNFPRSDYGKEYIGDMTYETGGDNWKIKEREKVYDKEKEKFIKEEHKYRFNYCLPTSWERDFDAINKFSFVLNFPKCAMWLKGGGGNKTCTFIRYQKGKAIACKGKDSYKHQTQVLHQSSKYDSMHLTFFDLENQLELPKAWMKRLKTTK